MISESRQITSMRSVPAVQILLYWLKFPHFRERASWDFSVVVYFLNTSVFLKYSKAVQLSNLSVTEMELADAPKDWTDGVLEEFEYWRALQNKKAFLWVHYEFAERAINFHLSQILCKYSEFLFNVILPEVLPKWIGNIQCKCSYSD